MLSATYSLDFFCVPLKDTVPPTAVSDNSDLWKDEELVGHYLKTGKDHFFAILVRRYKEKVFRLVLSVRGLSFTEEAEEVVQEVFLTVHRDLKQFRFDSRFSTWLYRIAFNRSIDWRRKPRLKFHHSGEGTLRSQASPRRSPLRKASDHERDERILKCVERLPEPARSVVFLHYWLDQSVAEIAQYLDLKSSTVKSHLFRARKLLGRSLRGKV